MVDSQQMVEKRLQLREEWLWFSLAFGTVLAVAILTVRDSAGFSRNW